MQKNILIVALLLLVQCVVAQTRFIIEEGFQPNMTDASGTDPNNPVDANGNPTAVVKVTSNVPNLLFESDYIITDVVNKQGVYEFFMAQGARRFTIKTADGSILPQRIEFKEYGIKRLDGKMCYTLKVTSPNVRCQGTLKVNYGPIGAVLYVDDKPYRGSDYLDLLDCGNHRIRVEKDEYETQTFEVYIEQGKTVEKRIELQQTSARLKIVTDDWCDIYLDGNKVGKYVFEGRVKMGKHRVEVRYGKHSKSQDVYIGKAGEEIELRILGRLFDDYSKSNTEYESGYDKIEPIKKNEMPERTIQSQTTTSVLGDYKVQFNRPGYWSRAKRVYVEPLGITTVKAPKLYKCKPWTFLLYQYSPKANAGLMLGVCGKVGGYISGRYNVGKPLFSGDVNPSPSANPFGVNSWSANGGLMFRFCQEMYMFVGAGYGNYVSDGSKFATYSHSGANVEGGFIFNIHGSSGKGFTLSVGYNTFVNKDYLKAYSASDALSNILVGIGFAL